MITYAFLAALVIPTCPPQLPTNFPLDPPCVFLGYLAHHKGYRCLDLSSNRVIISRHVVFDESAFPYAERASTPSPADFDFLDITNYVPAPIGPAHKFLSAGTGPSTLAQPRVATADTDDDLASSAALDALPASPPVAPAPLPAQPCAAPTSPSPA